jgi:predicted transcriptional regulator
MRRPSDDKLTRREREIMNALFALANRATAEDVRARLSDPPGYSAVRAMLVRLEKKGYLRHQKDGIRYVYSATTSHRVARRAALHHYLRIFFDGSLGQMMTALVRQEDWTDEELETLRAEIDQVRKGRKQHD